MARTTFPVSSVERCAIVLADNLSSGLAANGAALLALTAGQRYPSLVGEAFVDALGQAVPGMCPTGIPVLTAPALQLSSIRQQADRADVDMLVLPSFAQQTTSYSALLKTLSEMPADEWAAAGVMIVGPAQQVRALTRGFRLWGAA